MSAGTSPEPSVKILDEDSRSLAGAATAGAALVWWPDERDDAEALAAIGIDLDGVRDAVAANLGPDVWTSAAASRGRRLFGKRRHLPLDVAAKKARELSLREAIALDTPPAGHDGWVYPVQERQPGSVSL